MTSPAESRRGGRPRSAEIDAAALDVTLTLLDEVGYRRLSLEEVARRAGTSRPALYRRWPTRPALVLAALAGRLGAVGVPDTGCTMCDLGEAIGVFVAVYRRLPPDVIGSLLADCAGDADLHALFMTALFDPPRQAVRQTLAKAVARGDLRPDLDHELAVDLLGSWVHHRVLFGHASFDDADIETAVETLLGGIAADYPALREGSRQDLATPTPLHGLHSDTASPR
ncbi:TetR/AcrR family transcriptional regulator [Microlunatus sp. GCM10028923]|uniref:TetR/AcrR family transcriptional regulator n=1 Tax=Microlunatus sp. GCM10028923 TaxID=3273400 RepID=UPI0036080137